MNDIGLIGLAVMGQNLARNFASRGIKTLVYNRTAEVTDNFIAKHGNAFLSGEKNLPDFVSSLASPRKIILMVKAGEAIDVVIAQLLPLLAKDDIIIDGGNSLFSDTIRRGKDLAAKNIRFVGCGVSGGEEGALSGPSIMPGGEKQAVDLLLPYLEKIAAKDFAGKPCVINIGANGAGHYVKMVHNGIEYAIMQFLAETYDLLRESGRSLPDIAEIFTRWNQGRLASFLMETALLVVQKKDDQKAGFLVDAILDAAGQKGTGKWTVLDALQRGVAVPSINAAVEARVYSSQKELRTKLSTKLAVRRTQPDINETKLENALYLAMISAYAEGFELIYQAAKEENWQIDYAELVRIWQGGCIIRAELLRTLETDFRKNNSAEMTLLELPEIIAEVTRSLPALRSIVTSGAKAGIPLPGLMAALGHLEQIFRERSPANFVQGLRDSFGAHTFRRIDRDGVFHTDWNA